MQIVNDPVVWLPYADPEEAARRLGGLPDGIRVDCYRADGDDYPDSIAEVELYVLPYMKGAEVLERTGEMAKLRVIQTLTAGVENFLPYVPDGVTLCNAAGVHDASTAELAVALTLASGRHLDDFARSQPDGRWQPRFGRALADQRVLIIGYGRIGRAIERRLAGFEVASVTRVARRPRPGGDGDPPVHAITELPQLLPDADVAIVIAPATPETEGLIGADELALLPDDALLVNVARGVLVDTDALVAETRSGRLRAALDVTDPEPLPAEHPLWQIPNVLISPHVGGASTAFFPRADRLVAAQLRRFAAGADLDNVIAMSSDVAARDPDCIFCKIVVGEIPSRQVYADDAAIAFLDVSPWQRGHTLVVPRRARRRPAVRAADAGPDRPGHRRHRPAAGRPAGRRRPQPGVVGPLGRRPGGLPPPRAPGAALRRQARAGQPRRARSRRRASSPSRTPTSCCGCSRDDLVHATAPGCGRARSAVRAWRW